MIGSYIKRFLRFSIKMFVGTLIVSVTVGAVCIFLFAILAGIIAAFASHGPKSESNRNVVYGDESATHQFIALPIHGVIVGDSSDIGEPLGFFNESITYGYSVKKQLYDLADENSVSGVLLEINSPGGTIYGAKAIADGVSYYREKTKKPVVAFVSGLAASGAYWSAVSADNIVADVGTNVGSIGVITGPFQYYDTVIAQDGGLLSGGIVTQNGIETTFITAGKSKDFGSPYRRLTKEEISSLQGMVNNEYDTFVTFVSDRRNIEKATIVNELGALLYDGKTAVEKKMIDTVGSRHEAYALLAQKAGVGDESYAIVEDQSKGGILKTLLESRGLLQSPRVGVSFCGLTQVHLAFHGSPETLCQIQ